MNETLQKELDKLCAQLAATHNTTEKFINLCIQVNLIITKLGVVATFARSTHIDVKESVDTIGREMSNIVLVGAALAGFKQDETDTIMRIYQDVNVRVHPLVTAYYQQAPSGQRN